MGLSGGVDLDANATTDVSSAARAAMVRWLNHGNPSARHADARAALALLDAFREQVAFECGVALAAPGCGAAARDAYRVLITSGASESNSHIITAAVMCWSAKHAGVRVPTVITSSAEHHSILDCCAQLEQLRMARVVYLPVERSGPLFGAVAPTTLADACASNADICLVTIMSANNETGVVNPIHALAGVAHQYGLPFHTDAVQAFGKIPFDVRQNLVDAFSLSFHKLHGPPGVGALVVRASYVASHDLCALVCGSQNGGLRGGTENVPAVAGAAVGMHQTFAARAAVAARHRAQRARFMRGMAQACQSRGWKCMFAEQWARAPTTKTIVWVAPTDVDAHVLPGTLLVGVARPNFCNEAARVALERAGFIVGTGSACASGDGRGPSKSHVVRALGLDTMLPGGTLRISIADDVTDAEIDRFVRAACVSFTE